MSTFILAISCLTTSDLPWLTNLTIFQVPMKYCSYSIRSYFHYQSHPQLGIVFTWLHLFILSGVISPLFSSSILGTYQPGEFISLISFCLFILFMGFSSKNTEVVYHSLLQRTTFCQNSLPWPIHLGWWICGLPYSHISLLTTTMILLISTHTSTLYPGVICFSSPTWDQVPTGPDHLMDSPTQLT